MCVCVCPVVCPCRSWVKTDRSDITVTNEKRDEVKQGCDGGKYR